MIYSVVIKSFYKIASFYEILNKYKFFLAIVAFFMLKVMILSTYSKKIRYAADMFWKFLKYFDNAPALFLKLEAMSWNTFYISVCALCSNSCINVV